MYDRGTDRSGPLRDQARRGIVERSVQILREHGKSDEEIRSMMLRDFHIGEAELDEILDTAVN